MTEQWTAEDDRRFADWWTEKLNSMAEGDQEPVMGTIGAPDPDCPPDDTDDLQRVVDILRERDQARANARFWLGMSGENYGRAVDAEASLKAVKRRFRALAILSATVICGLFWALVGGPLWDLIGRWLR